MMKLMWAVALAGCVLCAADQPNVGDIVRRSVANTQADWQNAPKYSFTEHDVITKSAETTKTYRVLMIDGSPYNKLLAVNGEPLSAARAEAETRKLQREIAKRQGETADERRQRVAAYARERRQDNGLLQEMFKAIDFKLTGKQTVDGRACFVLEGTPKPGYQPINRDTAVLKGMRGKIWVDEQAYQWVKVEAKVFRPVTFGLFIARVEPGTEFILEQKPIEGNLWLPSHFSMRVTAKVLQFFSHNYADDETYSAYSLVSSDQLPSRRGQSSQDLLPLRIIQPYTDRALATSDTTTRPTAIP